MELYGFQDTDLIPELSEWQRLNGKNFGIPEWMQCNATPQQFIALSTIFYPRFAEYQGGIFYQDAIGLVKKSLKIHGENTKAILRLQKIYNHEHISDLFSNAENITKVQLECVGKILVDLWRLVLRSQFPHLDIRCELTGLDKEDLSDIIVTFWAEPKDSYTN